MFRRCTRLGVLLDSELSTRQHYISNVASTYCYHLRRLRQIRSQAIGTMKSNKTNVVLNVSCSASDGVTKAVEGLGCQVVMFKNRTDIETPTALRGRGMGRGSTVDYDFWGSIVALPSDPGGAPDENENDFGACCTRKTAFGE